MSSAPVGRSMGESTPESMRGSTRDWMPDSQSPRQSSTRAAAADLRLALPAVVCWGAAGALIALPDGVNTIMVALWVAAAVVTALAAVSEYRRHRRQGEGRGRRAAARHVGRRAGHSVGRQPDRGAPVLAFSAVCLAGAALIATATAVAGPVRFPSIAREAAAGHSTLILLVVVNSATEPASSFAGYSERVRFRGTITAMTASTSNADHQAKPPPNQASNPESVPVSIPVLVQSEAPAAWLAIGSLVRLSGTLRQSEPGDSAAAQLYGQSTPTLQEEPPWWLSWAASLRAGFSAAASALPGDGGSLLPGLAIGDTSAVGADLDDAMKQSSLSHLTAVSGANCAIIVAAVMMLGGYLRLTRGARIALSLVALGGFVVLVTPDSSVLRASVMATIVMLSLGAGRPGRGVPALSLAVIALLVFDPWLSRNYGFALSVLATAGLLLLAGPLARAFSRWMPYWLAAVIAIPLAAQLACQPVLLLLSPSLPLYGVPANLLAAPAAPVATVVGLVGCLLLPWLPGIANGCLQLAWVPSAWIAAVAKACATFPGSRLPWLGNVTGVLGLAVITFLAVALLLRDRSRPTSGSRLDRKGVNAGRGRSRPPPAATQRPIVRSYALRRLGERWPLVATAFLLAFGGIYFGSLLGATVGRAVNFPDDWQIAACDIGQGDAVVVRDADFHALIDVGPDPKPLAACLRTLGISRIDLLVLTHYDLDHIGGVDAVIGMVGTALVGVPENAQDQRLHGRLAEGGALVRQAAEGDTGNLGSLRWQILWPKRGGAAMQTGNAGSVTIAFDGRGIRSLFLGDLGEEAQDAMRAAAKPLPVDVVKVAHHGSADQSPELYERLHASAGVISVGVDNGYGHPTRRLLDILASAGTATFRTDRNGMVVIAAAPEGGGALTVWTEKVPARLPVGGPG